MNVSRIPGVGQAASQAAGAVRLLASLLETGGSALRRVADLVTPSSDPAPGPSPTRAPSRASEPVDAPAASSPPAAAQRRPATARPAAPPRPAPPPRAPQPPPRASQPPPPVPPHVSEEPELVAEVAEPGAEDGAGAEIAVAEPWPGYDALPGDAVLDALAAQSDAALAIVALYEPRHRRRRTVIEAARRQLQRRNRALLQHRNRAPSAGPRPR